VIRRAACAWILAALLAAHGAVAHDRSESYSHWYLSASGVTGTITIPLREVMLLYQDGDARTPPRELFRDHLLTQIDVADASGACERSSPRIMQAAPGFVRIELTYQCASSVPAVIRYRALFDVAPGHVHYATLYRGNAQLSETLLTDANDSWDIGQAGARPDGYSFTAFLRIGVEHISTGVDHIAFLLGLMLVAGTLTRTVIAVTGFTLGHSFSLAAAVLGYVRAESQLVEAFIGFTVALVAAEYFIARRPADAKVVVACLTLAWALGFCAMIAGFIATRELIAYLGFGVFGASYLLAAAKSTLGASARGAMLLFLATFSFGLVHGFGFAGFLMETGVLGTSLIMPLLGFNLGVEAGQLLLVAAAVLLSRLLGRHVPRFAPQLLAAGLCGTGLYWFIGRSLA
jgi:hypothetical protein